MQTEITCPLGARCEEAKDGKLLRCTWYTHLVGKHPQGEQTIDEWRCALAWMPIMLVENAQQARGMTAATESFRNESVKGMTKLNNILAEASAQRRLEE